MRQRPSDETTPRTWRWVRAGAALLVLLVALLPAAALANMANPSVGGDPAGEPNGPLQQIDVLHEQLRFDLRPLAAGDPAQVEATYRVRNNGPAVEVDLLFSAPGLAEGTVTVDGDRIAAQPAAPGGIPAAWQPPKSLPGFGERDYPYEVRGRSPAGLLFKAPIASGERAIAVQYSTIPSEYHAGQPYRNYQIAYVLAPARNWKSFGRLDLMVQLPAGWAAVTTLPLERAGDSLQGSFEGIPADYLGITIQRQADALSGFLYPFAALGMGAAAAVTLGFWAARLARRPGTHLLVSALLWIVPLAGGAIGLLVLGVLAQTVWVQGLDERHLSRAWSYGNSFTTLGIALLGFIGGGLAVLAGLLVGQFSGRPPKPALEGEAAG